VAVLGGVIRHDDAADLDPLGLKVLEEAKLVSVAVRDAVVANQRLGEDDDLATVGGISHGLGVTHQAGGEHQLPRDRQRGAKRGCLELLTRFELKQRGRLGSRGGRNGGQPAPHGNTRNRENSRKHVFFLSKSGKKWINNADGAR